MIITNSDNTSVPETIERYMSLENMNIEEFIMPGIPNQENSAVNGNYRQGVSGSTTPQYVASPAPSGSSTPGINLGHSISTSYSPANYSTHSPRMSHSPMVGLPVPSPQHSRPASANSSLGIQPISPQNQPITSPQVISHHQSSMVHMTSPSVGTGQDSPMASPIGLSQPSYNSPVLTSNATQPQQMIRSEIPSPVNRVSTQINSRPTSPSKRSSTGANYTKSTSRSMSEEIPPSKQPTITRGMHPMSHVSIPRVASAKSPSYKIFEMNRRLQERHPQNESAWWDYFVSEFFDDSATLTLTMYQEDGAKNFSIKRPLIPKFFKSFFEGGVVELYFNLRHAKEWLQNTSAIIDSEQCAMETLYIHPIYTKVISEGRMILEFGLDDMMRIKSWHYAARGWQEQIPRTVLSIQSQQPNPGLIQQWSVNITRQGFPATTVNFLRMCSILQPMQQLMTMHKTSGIDPRECLKKMLVQNWHGPEDQILPVVPREPGRPVPKPRKKRKNASEKSTAANPRKKRSQEVMNISPVANQGEVMVVGEPSMMGGAMGKDDERHITRIENMQLALEAIERGVNSNSSWLLDDVLASTLPELDGNLQG